MANTAQIKVLNWGDDLRLPTFTEASEFMPIVTQLEEYRSPSMPFQSKHLPSLKRNVWFALKRPDDHSRSGLLCIWPLKKACIFVLGKRVALLRLRIDSQLLANGVGLSLFVATLSPTSRRIWIEDTLVWKGKRLEHESFSQRLNIAKQLIDTYIIPEPQLISGIELELGKWSCLSSVQSDGSWDLISDDSHSRLYWRAAESKYSTSDVHSAPTPKLNIPDDSSSKSISNSISKQIETSPPTLVLVANANRESGPDQWSLSSSDGVSLGRALIRKMNISSSMNSSGQHTAAEVSWNADFNKWEILSVHNGPASLSSFFKLPK
jgi:hypothetical protein